MSEYHKIETLYERDPKTFKLLPELKIKKPLYGIIKTWQWTEKIDGTNIRVVYTPGLKMNCGGMYQDESLYFGGRTDNAQLHADLYRWLQENITLEKMRDVFADATEPVVLYGEGYGAGIQKGGGDYSPTKKFILFDAKVGSWWLSQENVNDVASKLGIEVVHHYGEMTLESATSMVKAGFPSALALNNTGTMRAAEGLIGRPIEALFDKKGSRLIIKLKTKDFAA